MSTAQRQVQLTHVLEVLHNDTAICGTVLAGGLPCFQSSLSSTLLALYGAALSHQYVGLSALCG
jgi:hypothetical protein